MSYLSNKPRISNSEIELFPARRLENTDSVSAGVINPSENPGELKKSADLFRTEPISSPTNSNLAAAEKTTAKRPERQRLLDEAVKQARLAYEFGASSYTWNAFNACLAAATDTAPNWIEETLDWMAPA